jgi:hypothetical protein
MAAITGIAFDDNPAHPKFWSFTLSMARKYHMREVPCQAASKGFASGHPGSDTAEQARFVTLTRSRLVLDHNGTPWTNDM